MRALLLVALVVVAGCQAAPRTGKPARPVPSVGMPPVVGARNVYSEAGPGRLRPDLVALPPRVYVPNNLSDTVSVIDPTTLRVLRTFRVGHAPQHSASWTSRTGVLRIVGGVLTGAMLSTFDLSLGPDGRDSIGGIFGEVYRELGIAFDPRRARAFFQEFVGRERGIRLLLGTRVRAPLVEDGRAVGAVLEDFRSIRARVVIDATDDADYAAAAGATYTLGREESGIDRAMQAATLMFRLRGVSWPRVVAYLRRYEKPARRGGVY